LNGARWSPIPPFLFEYKLPETQLLRIQII
jgi:hypothetical protein